MIYDVIIVGAGPSGYMCAYELTEKNPNLKILLVDKGRDIFKRHCPILEHKIDKCPLNKEGYQACYPACSITNGFGGAGAYSDGKFIITKEYGGWLTDYIPEDDVEKLIDYADQINLKFGATAKVTDPYTEKVKEIEKKALSVGVKLLRSKVRHLGTEENIKILERIYTYLQDKITMMFTTKITDVIFEDNKVVGIKTEQGEEFRGQNFVLAVGREGSDWLTNILVKQGVKMTQNQVDIGVRVECPNLVMEEINNTLYEGKFVFKTSTGNLVRTFCSNPGGHVVVENYDGVMNVNGHAYSDSSLLSQNTNFALLVSHHFTEPFKSPNEYAKRISALANQLACGGVIVQRYGDLKAGRRSTEKRIKEGFVKPTLKEAVPGDLALCLPQKTLQSIVEMIEVLDNITPGIATEHTLLYGVEAKYYSAHPEIDSYLKVEGVSNLYVAGDGAGLTRGLAQASACGIYIARNILERKN